MVKIYKAYFDYSDEYHPDAEEIFGYYLDKDKARQKLIKIVNERYGKYFHEESIQLDDNDQYVDDYVGTYSIEEIDVIE